MILLQILFNTIYINKPKTASAASLKAWKPTLDREFKIQNKDLLKLVKRLARIKNRKLLFEYGTANLAKSLKQIVKDLGLTDKSDIQSDFRREYDHHKLKDSERRNLAFRMLRDKNLAEKLYYHPEKS